MVVPTVSASLHSARRRFQCKTVSKLRRLESCYKVMRHTTLVYLRDVLRDVAVRLAVSPPQDVRYEVAEDMLVEIARDEVENGGACNLRLPRARPLRTLARRSKMTAPPRITISGRFRRTAKRRRI